MKTKLVHELTKQAVLLLALSTLNHQLSTVHAQGTAFTYQGRLNDGVSPANGSYDLRFTIYDSPGGGLIVGGPLTNSPTGASSGLFTVTLDFGSGVFTGPARWLEIGVRTNGSVSAYQVLSPRQPLTAVPYAVTAGNVTGLIPAGALSGTYPGAVTFNNSANVFAGNGAGLTSLNASQLTSGTVPAAALGNAWQIGGNAGTAPGTNFLGTTDNQPLELWVSQARALRLEPGTNIYSAIGAPNVIGGAPNNFVDGGVIGATIAGGGAVNMTGFMAGPSSNHVSAIFGTIGGGRLNTVGADHSTIAGGLTNTIQTSAYDSAIGGGYNNFIGLGAEGAVIGGGHNNSVSVNSYGATVGGGYINVIQTNSSFGTIAGGYNNTVQTNGSYGFIGGGDFNTIQANSSYATIAGGGGNVIQSNASGSTIGGGENNANQGDTATIGGGYGNVINVNDSWSTVGGGYQNSINGYGSTIGGGRQNVTGPLSPYATVAGGAYNTSSAWGATIGGGISNNVYGYYGTAGGGGFNYAVGSASTVPGGIGNDAVGNYSFAAGQYALASHDGAFVWSDDSVPISFSSTTSNQFNVRATGGVRFVTGGAGMTLDGQAVSTFNQVTNLDAADITSGTLSDARLSGNVALLNSGLNTFAGDLSMSGGAAYHHLQLSGGNANGYLYGSYPHWGDGVHLGYNYYADSVGGSHFSNLSGGTSRISVGYNSIVLATGDVGVQPNYQNVVVNGTITTVNGTLTVNGTFNNMSDRNAKRDFSQVSPSQILDEVLQLPISEWSYKDDPTTRHVGPVAQDFYGSFNIGTDNKHIAPIDEGGVALAAIQGLNQKVEAQQAELEQKETEVTELKQRLAALEQIVLKQESN